MLFEWRRAETANCGCALNTAASPKAAIDKKSDPNILYYHNNLQSLNRSDMNSYNTTRLGSRNKRGVDTFPTADNFPRSLPNELLSIISWSPPHVPKHVSEQREISNAPEVCTLAPFMTNFFFGVGLSATAGASSSSGARIDRAHSSSASCAPMPASAHVAGASTNMSRTCGGGADVSDARLCTWHVVRVQDNVAFKGIGS